MLFETYEQVFEKTGSRKLQYLSSIYLYPSASRACFHDIMIAVIPLLSGP